MHFHLDSYAWWAIGRYSAVAVFASSAWLARQTWLPHRHDGYVSVSGCVWKCSHCGRLPYIADPVTCPRCGDVRGRQASRTLWSRPPDSQRGDLCLTCYFAELRESGEWSACPACGRDNVATATMRDGMCARCQMVREAGRNNSLTEAFNAGFYGAGPPHLWELTAYGRGHGFHYARRRSTDAVERHYDGEPCECPNAAEYGPPPIIAQPGCGTD